MALSSRLFSERMDSLERRLFGDFPLSSWWWADEQDLVRPNQGNGASAAKDMVRPGALQSRGMDVAVRCELVEKDNQYIINAELPGVKKEDVKVNLDGQMLSISGSRKSEHEGPNYSERSYGSFSRTFSLPDNADLEKISGKQENGILTLTIGKKEPSLTTRKSITIQ